jgi:hypothetical protein
MNKAQRCRSGAPRSGANGEWMAPTVILLALPKCPACLALYVALATGFGISISTAAYLRLFLIVICSASLVFLVLRELRRKLSRV